MSLPPAPFDQHKAFQHPKQQLRVFAWRAAYVLVKLLGAMIPAA